jgi:hypothetical protein
MIRRKKERLIFGKLAGEASAKKRRENLENNHAWRAAAT